MSDVTDAISEQRLQVAKHKAAHEKRLHRNTKDIRDEIAHGAHYEPKDDPIYEYQPYPKWLHFKDKDSVLVQSKQEHDALLGIEPEPAKVAMVDVADLVKAETVPVRRGRPPKTQAAPLPAPLE